MADEAELKIILTSEGAPPVAGLARGPFSPPAVAPSVPGFGPPAGPLSSRPTVFGGPTQVAAPSQPNIPAPQLQGGLNPIVDAINRLHEQMMPVVQEIPEVKPVKPKDQLGELFKQLTQGLGAVGQGQAASLLKGLGGAGGQGGLGALGTVAGIVGPVLAVKHKVDEEVEKFHQRAEATMQEIGRLGSSILENNFRGFGRQLADASAHLPVFGREVGAVSHAMLDLEQATESMGRRLAQWNGEIALQMAETDIRRMERDFNRANRFEGDFVGALQSRQGFEEQLNSLMDRLTPLTTAISSGISDAHTAILSVIEDIVVEIATIGAAVARLAAEYMPFGNEYFRNLENLALRIVTTVQGDLNPALLGVLAPQFRASLDALAQIRRQTPLVAGGVPFPNQPNLPGL